MIGCYIHHHGAGHVSRAAAICHEVTALGHDVTGLSTLPRPERWQGQWVDLADDAVPVDGDRQDPTAGGTLHWAGAYPRFVDTGVVYAASASVAV